MFNLKIKKSITTSETAEDTYRKISYVHISKVSLFVKEVTINRLVEIVIFSNLGAHNSQLLL